MAYKPGESGNSAGRPPGQTPGAMLRKAILDDMPDIIATLVEQAKAGDTAASKILIDKVIPTVKSQALPVTVQSGDTLAKTGSNVIASTMNGDVSPDVSALLLSALSNQARIVEITDLENRISALEGTGNG